ncbi:hypothetical protein ACSSS7_004954 [Eimeria intestinalis]
MSTRLLFTLLLVSLICGAAAASGGTRETAELQVGEPLVFEAKTSGPPPAMRGRAPRSVSLVLFVALITSLAITYVMLLCFRAARNAGGGSDARRLASDDSSDGGNGQGPLAELCGSEEVSLSAFRPTFTLGRRSYKYCHNRGNEGSAKTNFLDNATDIRKA